MKFDSRSADAFGQVDIVVDNAGIPNVAPLTAWHKDRPAAGRAAAMLAFAAGLLVAALGARAADEPARPRPAAERAGTDSARAQPTAEQFAPPNQPDISADDARTSTRYIASSSVRRRQLRRAPARRPAFGQRQAMTPPGASGARPAFDRG
jgi:hypothetical protein